MECIPFQILARVLRKVGPFNHRYRNHALLNVVVIMSVPLFSKIVQQKGVDSNLSNTKTAHTEGIFMLHRITLHLPDPKWLILNPLSRASQDSYNKIIETVSNFFLFSLQNMILDRC